MALDCVQWLPAALTLAMWPEASRTSRDDLVLREMISCFARRFMVDAVPPAVVLPAACDVPHVHALSNPVNRRSIVMRVVYQSNPEPTLEPRVQEPYAWVLECCSACSNTQGHGMHARHSDDAREPPYPSNLRWDCRSGLSRHVQV